MRTANGSMSLRLLLGIALAVTASARADTITVFAAASLTEAFRTIGKDFEAAHPGTKVDLQLRRLLDARSPDHRGRARRRVRVGGRGEHEEGRRRRRRHRYAAAVRRQSPRDHRAARQPEACEEPRRPVSRRHGHLARRARGAGGTLRGSRPSQGGSAGAERQQRGGRQGRRDARRRWARPTRGVVYATDVAAGGDKVEAVAIPDAHNVIARYPIATLKGATNAAGARAFVAYVLSPAGQRVLEGAGFLAP